MNAWQKTYQGWFGGCNGVKVTSSGTFTLLPFEQQCNGVQFLQIKAPEDAHVQPAGGAAAAARRRRRLDYYYLELRTPLDFDGTLGNGASALSPRVLLHVGDVAAHADAGRPAHVPARHDTASRTSSFSDAALHGRPDVHGSGRAA